MAKLLFSIILLLCQKITLADYIQWADWTSATGHSASGTMGDISLSFTGHVEFTQLNGGINLWSEGDPMPYTGSSLIDNAPPNGEFVATSNAGTKTIEFSRNVVNPIMAICGLGQQNWPVAFDFDAPFELLSAGTGFFGEGSYILEDDNVLVGRELHAAIQFTGSFDAISWHSDRTEIWHGFTFGSTTNVANVPEPATMGLVFLGLVGLAAAKRRKRS